MRPGWFLARIDRLRCCSPALPGKYGKEEQHMKNIMKLLAASSLALAMCLFGFSTPAGAAEAKGDIIDVAVSAGSFNTLAAALKAAGLVETLQGMGPFTVFAPTDDAFAKLPAGTVESLLKPENKAKLAGILTYHVVAGTVMAKDVVNLKSAKTVNGKELTIKTAMGKVMVDGATVTKTDIMASNGVIHVIDTVVLPQ